MNYRLILKTLGYVMIAEAFLMLLPLIVCLLYGEDPTSFSTVIIPLAAIGMLLMLVKVKSRTSFASEGILIVAISWILMSAFGAIPFVLDGAIPSYIDALFETVSGFSTTGATILANVEALPLGLLFWRSFTHWIGGMGVLVFILAVFRQQNARSIHVLRAEMPGPSVKRFFPQAKNTARALYLVYILLTLIEVIFLLCGGLSLYDSLVTSFATAGTGGFSVKNASIAAYGSSYVNYVVASFMLLFGLNFNVYFFLIMRSLKQIFKIDEVRIYLGVIAVTTGIICANIYGLFGNFADAFEQAFFQVSSIITTTGFATTDFNLWPTLSKCVLFLLMLVGACGGSTGGGIKVSRIVIIVKKLNNEIKKMTHPKMIRTIKMDGGRVESETVSDVCLFFIAYIGLSILAILLVSIDGFDLETTISSVFACIGNVGPGFGLVGPSGNFAAFSDLSKIVLSFAMLLGRLEIFPILILLFPSLYKKS